MTTQPWDHLHQKYSDADKELIRFVNAYAVILVICCVYRDEATYTCFLNQKIFRPVELLYLSTHTHTYTVIDPCEKRRTVAQIGHTVLFKPTSWKKTTHVHLLDPLESFWPEEHFLLSVVSRVWSACLRSESHRVCWLFQCFRITLISIHLQLRPTAKKQGFLQPIPHSFSSYMTAGLTERIFHVL